jgi:hypothetical protein
LTKGHYLSTIFIITLISILACLNSGLSKATYGRSADFPAIQMSYDDLTSIIKKTQSVIRSANGFNKVKWESSKITITQGSTVKFIYEGEITKNSFNDAPQKGFSINYQYRSSGGPISDINITLDDYRRVLEVEGESSEQVDAIFAMISESLVKLEITFGGGKQRIFIGLIVSIISMILFIFLPNKRYGIFKIPLLLIVIFGIYFPYSNYYPGAAIYVGDASFFSRNSGTIAILSLFVGLVGIIPTIYWLIKRLSHPKQS